MPRPQLNLRALLKPVAAPDLKDIGRLTTDLDSESFSAREKATKELQKLGDLVLPALKKLLANPPSLEVKLRVQLLLDNIALAATSPDRMRPVRAIEALENMGTREALELLRDLARGAPGARITREAAASLERFAKKRAIGN